MNKYRQEIYLDFEKTQPVTNFEVDEYNYAVIRSGEWYVFGESRVVALGHAEVKAYDKAQIEAREHSWVDAYNNALVPAFDYAIVRAFDNAEVNAYDHARVRAHDHSLLFRYGDASYVRIVRLVRKEQNND